MDTSHIKKDFPMFATHPDMVYLDTAATALTPQSVVDAMCGYYTTFNANVARGLYRASTEATAACERARARVAAFLGMTDTACVIFTSGTTMSLNMIATGLTPHITTRDNVVTTIMEHHANFIPWQRLCRTTGATFRIATLTEDGTIDADHLLAHIDDHTRLVALTFVSNTLGTINPIADLIRRIRTKNPTTLIAVDAAQAAPHLSLDLTTLDCDFCAFSMHKVYGPTGVGILAGKRAALEQLEPLLVGGEMIAAVSTAATSYADLPHRLEGGTPNIAGIVGTHAALDYLARHDADTCRVHEHALTTQCITALRDAFGDDVHIYGPADPAMRAGVVSFTLTGCHPHDVAQILDTEKNVAVRAGQHCAMPLHLESLRIGATVRVSFGIYNTADDITALIDGLRIAHDTLAPRTHV